MLTKVVKKIIGVEDAPKWLEKEVFRKMAEYNLDLEGAVNYLAPLILETYRTNISKYRPGRASVRKASGFMTAELIERWGFQVEFVHLFGEVFPAAVRGEGLYTPFIPIFDNKRKSLYIAAKSRKYLANVIQLTTARDVEGVLVDVVKIDKPPFYYLYTEADLEKMIKSSTPISASPSKRQKQLYNYWKLFRERGYLVLVGKEIGGVKVDLLAVGLGKYAVVNSSSKYGRLRKVVDSIYFV